MGGAMSIFSGVKEALAFAKDAQTLPVLRERVALAQEQLAVAEKKVAEREAENADLLRENRELRKGNESLKAKIAEYEHKPAMVDIGPCAIKLNKNGNPLLGFYCNACGSLLDRAHYDAFGDAFACQKCKDYRVAAAVDDAIARYLDQSA